MDGRTSAFECEIKMMERWSFVCLSIMYILHSVTCRKKKENGIEVSIFGGIVFTDNGNVPNELNFK